MIRFSKEINNYLRSTLVGEPCSQLSNENINILFSERLINDDLVLTDLGESYAISLCSLNDQCKQLTVDYNTINSSYEGAPEEYALGVYLKNGYIGVYAEGYFLHAVIKSLLLDVLTELNVYEDREDAVQRYLPAQFIILKRQKRKLLADLSACNFNKNYKEIISNRFIIEVSKGLCTLNSMSIKCATEFLNLIVHEDLKFLIEALIDDPDLCFGWPDLTLIKENKIYLLEIKTSDSLSLSQIRVIKKFKAISIFNFGVLQIR